MPKRSLASSTATWPSNPFLAGLPSSSNAAPLALEAAFVGSKAALNKQLAAGDTYDRVQSGQTVLVISHTVQQIERLTQQVVMATYKQPLVIIDEADNMFTSADTGLIEEVCFSSPCWH